MKIVRLLPVFGKIIFQVPFFPVLNIVSISGGKDSAATLLLALEQKVPNLMGVFADTGNENQITYEYVNYLEQKTGVPILWLKADFSLQIERKRQRLFKIIRGEKVKDNRFKWTRKAAKRAIKHTFETGNPFLDLCILKGRFPSTKARFCSTDLKREVLLYQLQFPLIEQGFKVISWQGVRADESEERSKLSVSEYIGNGVTNYRPILHWSALECFDMHFKYGVEPNSLYKQGMGRVGCMPCIHCRKDELRAIADRFPEEIDRIEKWERKVSAASRLGSSTFFHSDNRGHGIRELVEWSKTERGGKQYSLIAMAEEGSTSCSSIYGLCE
ncbi:phosphoadenosine phosphosulfate reductase domain-containing protein [Acinetobacter seifertii]|uniref:phosphoadenosine phosphosulfate reductase domain-containing protein n=1 Tax=Acinetobacter seifertii TaxID=1530123 RepID=UPI001903F184|nr:phosphoadenosine phosphosulfate reductase family protein [Acinetobacter seifertii]MBJ9425181.1 phosphoadenosine phosphosulfate reductase family protein [Acinetobacter seifertii]